MSDVAAAEPMAPDTLVAYAQDGRCWAAVDSRDQAVGFVVVDLVDGCAHVEQISVHPEHQGRGLARRLLKTVDLWATERGLPATTLTTFTAVPWNQPLYEHLGFVVLDEAQLSPGLRKVRDAETSHGLDPRLRVCMQRTISPTAVRDA